MPSPYLPDWAAAYGAPVEIDADRFVVLLVCGHWLQSGHPYEERYDCPEHGLTAPARSAGRKDRAVMAGPL